MSRAELGPASTRVLSDRIEALERTVSTTNALLKEERNRARTLEGDVDKLAERIEGIPAATDLRQIRQELGEMLQQQKGWQEQVVQAVDVSQLELQDQMRQSLASADKATARQLQKSREGSEALFASLQDKIAEADSSIRAACDKSIAQGLGSAAELLREQRDHADAINNIMDMLESTATRDDFARAAEQSAADTEAKLGALEGQLMALLEEQAEEHDQLYSTVSSSKAELESALDERLKALESEVGDVKQTARDNQDDAAAKLVLEFKGLERGCERRIVDIERHVSQTLQSVEVWGERVSAQSILSDQVSASVQALEAKMESGTELLQKETDHQVRQCRDMIDGRLVSVETKLTHTQKALQDAQAQAQSESADATARAFDKLDSKLQAMRRQLDTAMTRADGVLHLAETIEGRVDREFAEGAEKFDRRLAEATAKMDQVTATTAEQSVGQQRALDDLKDGLARAQSKAEEANTAAEGKLDDVRRTVLREMDEKARDLASSSAAELSRLSSEFGLGKQETANAVAKLQDVVTTQAREINDKLAATREGLTDHARKMEQSLAEKNTAQDNLIADNHAQLSKLHEALAQRVADRSGVVDARLAEQHGIINANHSAAAVLVSRAETKLLDRSEALERQLESTRGALTTSIQGLEAKNAEVRQSANDLVNDRCSSLANRLQEAVAQMGDRTAAIDRRFTQWGSEFSEQNRHSLEQSEARVDGATTRLDAAEATLAKVASLATETQTTAQATASSVTKLFADVDKRLREAHQDALGATDRARSQADARLSVLSDAVGALETSHRSLAQSADAHGKEVEQQRAQFAQEVASLAARHKADRESALSGIQQVTADVNAVKLSDEKRVRAAEEHFNASVSTLQQQLQDDTSRTGQQLGDLKRLLTDEIAGVMRLSKAADAEHDRRIKSVLDDIAQQNLEQDARCQELEGAMLDRDKAAGASMTELRATVNERIAESKTAMTEMEAAVVRRAAQVDDEMREKQAEEAREVAHSIKAIDRKIDRVQTNATDRADELERTMGSSHRDLVESASRSHAALATRASELEERLLVGQEKATEELRRVEDGSSEARDRIEQKFSARTTALLERLNTTTEVATAAKDRAEKAHELLAEAREALGNRIDQAAADAAAATAAVGAASEDRDQQLKASVQQLEAEMGVRITTAVETLEKSIESCDEKLASQAKTLEVVGEQAATAESTATRLELLKMDVEEASSSIKALDEQAAESEKRIDEKVDAVETELADLGVELSLVGSMVDSVK